MLSQLLLLLVLFYYRCDWRSSWSLVLFFAYVDVVANHIDIVVIVIVADVLVAVVVVVIINAVDIVFSCCY